MEPVRKEKISKRSSEGKGTKITTVQTVIQKIGKVWTKRFKATFNTEDYCAI